MLNGPDQTLSQLGLTSKVNGKLGTEDFVHHVGAGFSGDEEHVGLGFLEELPEEVGVVVILVLGFPMEPGVEKLVDGIRVLIDRDARL
jgi:hypothetical protein